MKKKLFLLLLSTFAIPFSLLAQTRVVTASNDPSNNALLVYNVQGELLQTLSTGGRGGVPPHIIGGGIAKNKSLLAVINFYSQNVSLFAFREGLYKLIQVVPAHSQPVSVAFGRNHLYILGTNTIESHLMKGERVEDRADGFANLLITDGSAAQVGFLGNQLIVSQRSNMIETVDLNNGTVTSSITPVQLPEPPYNKVPLGLATRGSSAYVTIAHSNEVGVVKDGHLESVISTETQQAPCWMTALNSWVFCCNTPSKSISRYNITDTSIEIAELIAIKTKGQPTDIDSNGTLVAAIELSESATNLSYFHVDTNGGLTLMNSFPTATSANGVAVVEVQEVSQ